MTVLFKEFEAPAKEISKTHNPKFIPSHNLLRSDKGYELEMMVSGYAKENIDIDLKEEKMTVKGHLPEAAQGDTKFIRRGFRTENFEVVFTISDKINTDGITATCVNGVLRISLPFREEVVATPQRINIQ